MTGRGNQDTVMPLHLLLAALALITPCVTVALPTSPPFAPASFADGALRLTGGNATSGRLEIYSVAYGSWGTVCDDSFDLATAKVACGQLGLPVSDEDFYDTVPSSDYYGPPPTDDPQSGIYFDDFSCTGSESRLVDCYTSSGTFPTGHNCRHSEDIALTCAARAATTSGPCVWYGLYSSTALETVVDGDMVYDSQLYNSCQDCQHYCELAPRCYDFSWQGAARQSYGNSSACTTTVTPTSTPVFTPIPTPTPTPTTLPSPALSPSPSPSPSLLSTDCAWYSSTIATTKLGPNVYNSTLYNTCLDCQAGCASEPDCYFFAWQGGPRQWFDNATACAFASTSSPTPSSASSPVPSPSPSPSPSPFSTPSPLPSPALVPSPTPPNCREQPVNVSFVLTANYTNCFFFAPGDLRRRPPGPGSFGDPGWPAWSMDCVLINNSFPSPTLTVYKGDWVRVDFINGLLSRNINLHWHGLAVRGTPWADGTSFVNSCPVRPGDVATHLFQVQEAGTYFYHGHAGVDEDMGMSGALVIKDRDDPHLSLYDDELDHVLEIRDWWRSADGHYGSGIPFNRFVAWGAPLINGFFSGNYSTLMSMPLYTINVATDYCYRIRFAVSNTNWPGWRINITDGETGLPVSMTVIAHTAMNNAPTNTHSLAMYAAQRGDIVLCTKATPGTYLMTVKTAEIEFINYDCSMPGNNASNCIDQFQVLFNVSATQPVRQPRTANRGAFASFRFVESFDPLVTPDVVQQQGYMPIPFPDQAPSQTWNVYLGIWGPQYYAWVDRGWGSKLPTAPLTFSKGQCGTAQPPDPAAVIRETVLKAHLAKDVQYGEVVDIIFHNLTPFVHPMHLHGHNMWVLGSRYRGPPNHNQTEGSAPKPNDFCKNYPWLWAMPAYDSITPASNWTGVAGGRSHLFGCPYQGDAEDQEYMLASPYSTDIVPVPARSWTKVRVKFDNPGSWYLHCHLSLHMLNGMGFFVNVALERVPKTPAWVDTSCGGACQPVDQICGDFSPQTCANACIPTTSADNICAPRGGLYPRPQWT